MLVQSMPFPASVAPPTAPTETYEYDDTGRPWTIATSPNGVYHAASDETLIAWEAQSPFRHAKVASYDHATDTPSDPVVIGSYTLADDDHGLPSLAILSDGRAVCAYGSHNTDQLWSISAQSGGNPDITTWTAQTPLTGAYTYPHLVNIDAGGGAGTLYFIARKRVSTSPIIMHVVARSASYTSGGAVTFGSEITLFNADLGSGNGGRPYLADVVLNGSDIEFFLTVANGLDTTRQHVYFMRYKTATGALENLSGGTSTASGSLPITVTTANASYREKTNSGSNIAGWVSWCKDTNGYKHILWGDDTTDPWDIRHDWHNGTSWQGETVAFTVDRKGAGGFVEAWHCIAKPSGAVDAYYSTGGSFTGRGGEDMARKTWGGSWGSEEIVLEGDGVTALGNPVAVRNADADLRVMFTEVAQDELLASGYEAKKRYFLGDSGFLEWPAPSDPDQFRNILTMNFEGANGSTSIVDESQWRNRHPVTVSGNAQISTAVTPPWGTSWLKLDGTGDYLIIPNSYNAISLPGGGDWHFDPGDSFETYLRVQEIGRIQNIINTLSGSNGAALIVDPSNSNRFRFLGYNGSLGLDMIGTTSAVVGGQYMLGVKRKTDGSWELRVNGSVEATGSAYNVAAGSKDLYIGRSPTNTSRDFNGYIKQLRWTKMADRDLSVAPTALFPA